MIYSPCDNRCHGAECGCAISVVLHVLSLQPHMQPPASCRPHLMFKHKNNNYYF
ncbi:hypothetical protein Nmel_001565 [Mimus melanotis]